ncbi:Scr1 family TA system antitoxin-like transcriptional regulator [Streptomyces sp. NPDC102360]|uniref:helix-turn-helix domain-containing protein n=1 Tax=Streptomyces sp. NPDC102360 TaxID=3366160 RepID=UPI00381A4402
MTGPKDLDPSSRRVMIGEELRHARERADLTQQSLGELLFVSGSYVGQMEAGTRRILPDMAARLDEELKTGGFFARNCVKANRSRFPEHFAEAAEAEAIATAIRQYAALLIPGLLQTRAYAEAVFHAYQPTAPDDRIDGLVADRLTRARLLDDPTTPLLWTVLDEAALRRAVGGPQVMAEALHHVADLARRHRVLVQVLPFGEGAHAAMEGTLKLMEFEDAPPLSFVEAPDMGRLTDDPATVARHTFMFNLLQATALSPLDSLALIETVAQDYAHEEQHP